MYEEKNIIPKPITVPEENPKEKKPFIPGEIIAKTKTFDTREHINRNVGD